MDSPRRELERDALFGQQVFDVENDLSCRRRRYRFNLGVSSTRDSIESVTGAKPVGTAMSKTTIPASICSKGVKRTLTDTVIRSSTFTWSVP